MIRYGFIGTGSMGSMLISGFIRSGLVTPADIIASSKTGVSARALAERTGIAEVPDNRSVAADAAVLFICVRPHEVKGVLDEIRETIKPGTLLVSIAGSVSHKKLEEWGRQDIRYVRVIPSVTAEQNGGVALVVWGRRVPQKDKRLLLDLLNAISSVVEMDEGDLEVCTNLTSCGPALIAAMLKEFGDAAVRTGSIRPELADYLVKETVMGTARILTDEQTTFDTVIERVATKGGSTEEGVRIIHAGLPGIMDTVHEVLLAKRRLIAEQIKNTA